MTLSDRDIELQISQELMRDSINSISLKNNPTQFLENLQYCVQNDLNVVWQLSNTLEHNTWYSSLLHCLFYLTGDLRENVDCNFYGNKESIPEELAIDILYWMDQAGVDYNVQNYYGKTVYDYIIDEEQGKFSLGSRTNNKNFLRILKHKCEQYKHTPSMTLSYDDRQYHNQLYDYIEHSQYTC